MLTIREPIKLKAGRPLQGIHHDMAERMQANYGLMNLSVRKEELLHITSQPAEIYFADSENFQILTNINNQNQQEVRLEVINNLMNRILVAQTENFTYQDTVYISSILRKLGIRDEKTFMKQVFALQNEHKETRQLLQKYETNQELLQQLIKSEDTAQASGVIIQPEITEQKLRYYIHDEIYHRLKTDKIYQDIRQFTKTYVHESSQINPREMQVAEQTKIAQNFQLQNIKNEIIGKDTPLYYLNHNRYEYLQEITESTTLDLEEQITAAILLNLTEQSYILRQNQIEENSHYWYSIAKSLFQTAENTWKRYETNLMERKMFSSLMLQMHEEVNEVKHLEGDIIRNIVDEYYSNLQQWKEENEVKQSFLIQRNIQEAGQLEVHFSGGSYHLTQEEFQLNFLNEDENEEQENENSITTQQLQKQLELYNQKNYENYQKIKEIEKQQVSIKDRKVNRRKAQMDALRALEKPEEVLIEYLTAENKDPMAEATEKVGTQIYELFSEETKEIYRQFLAQNTSENTTFLEHVMNQPRESEIRQEVIQVLEQVEKQEEVVRTKHKEAEVLQQQKFVITEDVKEKVTQQLMLWKEIQEYPISELEEVIYLQSRAKEVFHTQEIAFQHLKEEIEKEKYQESTVTRKVNEDVETQLTLLKDITENVIIDSPETEYLQSRVQELVLLKETQKSKKIDSPETEYQQSKDKELRLLKEIQQGEKIDSPETERLQSKTEEEFYTQEMQFKHLKDELEAEKHLKSTSIHREDENVEIRMHLRKDIQEGTVNETPETERLQSKTEEEFHTQEMQFKYLRDEIETEKYLKATTIRKEDENVEIQMHLLKDIQEGAVSETPKTERLQSKTEEEFLTQEMQFKHLKDELETERHLKATSIHREDENVEIQRNLLKNIQEGAADETTEIEHLQSRREEEFHTQEMQFKHLKDELETEKHLKATSIHREDENVEIQMHLLKDIQEGVAGETPEVEYLQNRVEKIFSTQELRLKQLKDELETKEYLKSSITKRINEDVETQLTFLKDVREDTVIDKQETEYLQSREKEEFHTQEIAFRHLKEEIEAEKRLESTITQNINENVETQLTLLKDVQESVESDSPKTRYLQERTDEIMQTREIQYTQLRENVEKQMKRQMEELAIINTSMQKEVRMQQVEFVHKKEEQVINEELLEEIREQSQKMVKTQQTEETTVQNNKEIHQVVQDSVNRMQTNRMEDIEEIVQKSVRRQLNQLSEQVYGKLEKKLQTERKRRGYF